ncbi:MAG TPA: nuclear transport factor 2 family protein [Aliidongia sp.]|uniref:nuclear transport factor 2 family protein n=1 Tax=Aliidongia sp. TaxID=1914230 RepID=UPI002DDCD82A|nr:nuclear transport factor 2 family protein [Aliidongia sp.]HEV2676900.1 nuclear transport factor 2 family protein [Aliidongia sp.]
MSDAQQIAHRYIAAWNETDADRRAALLGETWADDALYIDPMGRAAGRAEIGSMIGAVQQRFPGFRFTLIRPADGYGDHVRFAWSLGPVGAEAPIEGSDVVILDGGRIARVIGFLDKLPQAA